MQSKRGAKVANQEPEMSLLSETCETHRMEEGKSRCSTCAVIGKSRRTRVLSWITILLAFTFYLLTLLYAWHPEWVSQLEAIGGSPAKALQLLAILSGIANPVLSMAIGQAVDAVWGMLVARPNGFNMMDNHALLPGISLDGLWQIVSLRHSPRFKPKAWAVMKIVSMMVVPILAILILTNIEAAITFYALTTVAASRGYGIGTFNASLATLLNPMTDLTFSTRFKDFLSDSDRAIETTSDADRDACASDFNSTCRSTYFVPGGVENFAPALLAGKNFSNTGAIQPVLALNQRGYSFEFEDDQSPVEFDPDIDCITSGFVIGSFQLCLKNKDPYEIQAYITSCPKEVATNAACLRNTSWHLQRGWRTNLATFARFATIAYNGLNGTILSHTYTDDSQIPININAMELLQAYDTLLGSANLTSPFGIKLSLLGLGSNKPVLPLSIWEYFQGLETRSEGDSRTNRQATLGLQSILALTLYHCQGKDFNELRQLLVGNAATNPNVAQTIGQDIIDMFPSVDPDTDIVPAILRYNLKVDRSILLAYIILAGTTLALCLAAQIASSCTKMGQRMRQLSPFPPLDCLCEYEIRYCEDDSRVAMRDFRRLNGLSAREQLDATARMYIALAPDGCGEIPRKAVSDDDDVDDKSEKTEVSFMPVSGPSFVNSHFF